MRKGGRGREGIRWKRKSRERAWREEEGHGGKWKAGRQ